MTTIALSTLQMAQTYANRLGLQYDHKEYPFGGGHFTCYDDAGEPIYTIKYHGDPIQVIDKRRVFEIFMPNANRYEEYATKEAMLADFDIDELHVPYESERTTYHNGAQVVTRHIMYGVIENEAPFSAEFINLLNHSC
jgi:hypothetical protein